MSYNPTNWVNGETPINDSNLNHIEQGIKDVADLSDAQEIKIADIANNQIPEEYLQQSVDNYIANNQAGLATKTDVTNLDSKLSSEIVEIETDIENMFESSVNLFNKDKITKDMAVQGNGTISDENAVGFYCISEPIEVKPNTTYTKNNNEYAMYLDSTLNKISINSSPWEVLETPSNCAYIITNVRYETLDGFMLVEGTELPSKYEPYNKTFKESLIPNAKPYVGYHITSFGDSLVENGGWQNYLIENLGCTHTNNGTGGTTMTYRDNEYYYYSDGRYASETAVEGATLCNSTIGGDDRINLIPSNTNILLVEFSTNDFHQDKQLGTWNDTDNTTFRGAMKYLAKKVRERLPECKIIFMTPTRERTSTANNLGLYKRDYVDAILEAQSNINVPVIDLWSKTSWGVENFNKYSSDDIHWNAVGKKVVGEIVCGYLLAEKPLPLETIS